MNHRISSQNKIELHRYFRNKIVKHDAKIKSYFHKIVKKPENKTFKHVIVLLISSHPHRVATLPVRMRKLERIVSRLSAVGITTKPLEISRLQMTPFN